MPDLNLLDASISKAVSAAHQNVVESAHSDVSQSEELTTACSPSSSKEEQYEQTVDVRRLKYEWYDAGATVTVRLLTRNCTGIRLYCPTDQQFNLIFQTTDSVLLDRIGATEKSKLLWKQQLAYKIDPLCPRLVPTGRCLELRFQKENAAERWAVLIPLSRGTLGPSANSNGFATTPTNSDEALPLLTSTSNGEPYAKRSKSPPPFSESSVGLTGCDSYASTALSPSVVAVSSSTSADSTSVKPTCKVLPYVSEKMVVRPGYTGLQNVGNTCYINSVLQVLCNIKELHEFLIGDYYKVDINRRNKLGSGGKLISAFAKLVRDMWSGTHYVIEPSEIKALVARKAPQFAGMAQHDAQEFLSFLLDGLHEDVNRVRQPVVVGKLPDHEHKQQSADVAHGAQLSATEAWLHHKARNDSLFVDLFHGQFKSTVRCNQCHYESITFDPFVYLSVPFPVRKRVVSLYYWTTNCDTKPELMLIEVNEGGCFGDVIEAIALRKHVATDTLRPFEVYDRYIFRLIPSSLELRQIMERDIIFVFQVQTRAKEEIVNVFVVQRLLCDPKPPPGVAGNQCEHCAQQTATLSWCTGCYQALYCGSECQSGDWTRHKAKCEPEPRPVRVGQPFLISLPRSIATQDVIRHLMGKRCRFSVNVFEYPVTASESDNQRNGDENEKVPMSMPCKDMRSVFLIRQCDLKGYSVGSRTSNVFNEKGGVLDSIKDGSVLAMDWYNRRGIREVLSVESKVSKDCYGSNSNLLEPCRQPSTTDVALLNKNDAVSLSSMLQLFPEKEHLSAKDCWCCDRCKVVRAATKQLELRRLPEVLIIQLKRFTNTYEKNHQLVDYPSCLDVCDYLCDGALSERGERDGATQYDLTGVVCHSGSRYWGHYVGFAQLTEFDSSVSEVGWRRMDDTRVDRCTDQQLKNPDAYLLFYKRRGGHTERLMYNYQLNSDLLQDASRCLVDRDLISDEPEMPVNASY